MLIMLQGVDCWVGKRNASETTKLRSDLPYRIDQGHRQRVGSDRSVCVCTLLITCSLNIDLAGECGMIVGPHSTKLPQSWDTGSDQPSVPASEDSDRLS